MRRGREKIPVMKRAFQRIRSSGGERALALALSGALLLSTTGLGVYAVDLDGSRNGEGGVVLSYGWPEGSGITWSDAADSWTMTVPVEEDSAFTWENVRDQLPESIIAQVQPSQEDEAAELQESGESTADEAVVETFAGTGSESDPSPASRTGDETGLISTYSEGDATGGDSMSSTDGSNGNTTTSGDSADTTPGEDDITAPTTPPNDGSEETTPGTGDGDITTDGDNADTTPGEDDKIAPTTPPNDGSEETTPGTDGGDTTIDGGSENTTPDGSNGNSNIVESPEERNVNLTWERTSEDSDAIMAEASLPDGYTLGQDVPPLTVAVTAAPAETMNETELSLSDFADFVVPEPDAPQGTVINLFDYWTEGERNAADNGYHADDGINNEHSLKFGQGMATGTESINAYYSESAKPHTGIVESILEDGFPVLAAGNNWSLGNSIDDNKITNRESLDYLFSTKDGTGKKAFANVEGLLQTDEDGYYYYNSQENYAYFNEVTNKFILYQENGVKAAGSSPDGQFFPFASPEEVFTISENKIIPKADLKSNDGSLNHFFGLSMSTRFVQEEGGMTPGGNAVTYNFSGDDDVWVFIDDVLVADLGGIHDMLSLEINFSTGKVIVYDDTNINNQYDSGEEVFNGNGNGTTLRAMFEAAEREDEVEWSGNDATFADGTYHTLKFFYLERGHTDSNLSLKFNLTPIPESEITKVDQVGNPMEDITFDLYAVDDNSFSIKGDDQPIWSGTTDEYGNLKILDAESNSAIAFGEFAQEYRTNYFVLKEREVPKGYRSEGETRLEYDPGTGVILSRDYWTTGSYAAPKVTATATSTLYEADKQGKGKELISDLYGKDLEKNPPIIFAVVFKRLDMTEDYLEESNWAPVSGSLEDGWTVRDDSNENINDRILEAAKNSDGSFKNTFQLTKNGAFQVTVEDLPGDVTSYYWYQVQKVGGDKNKVDGSKVAYTLNCYYLDKSGIPQRLYTDEFDRTFSTHIYMSNIKDYLLVEKVNEKNEAMNGAEFALYTESAIKQYLNTDGTVNLEALNKANVPPYDSGTTDTLNGNVSGKGLLLFPTAGKFLEQGTYYLVETDSGNDNYKINPTAVKVIVDETGVYADAGTKDDGVSTGRLVGSVLKSMLRFVRDDGVDATLNNIKVQILTAKEEPSENGKWDWSGWKENSTKEEEQHLYYYGRRDENTYGMEYSPTDDKITLKAKTETGWNKLAVRQCLKHEGSTTSGTVDDSYTESGSLRQDLGTRDISNLFSSVMLVTVENEPKNNPETTPRTGSLTIKK